MKNVKLTGVIAIILFLLFESIYILKVVLPTADVIENAENTEIVEYEESKNSDVDKIENKEIENINENIIDNVKNEEENAEKKSIFSEKKFVNFNGNEIKDGFVYYNGDVYYLINGEPVKEGLLNTNKDKDRKWNDAFYYIDKDGRVCDYVGNVKLNGQYYFFSSYNNRMLLEPETYKEYKINGDKIENRWGNASKNCVVVFNNKTGYLLNEYGLIIKEEGLYCISKFDANGVMVRSKEDMCYVKSNGQVAISEFVKIDDKYYYANSSGCLVKNTFVADRYYFDENYQLVLTIGNYGDFEKEAKNWIRYIRNSGYNENHFVNLDDAAKNRLDEIAEYFIHNDETKIVLDEPLKLSKINRENFDEEELLIVRNKFIYVDSKDSESEVFYVDNDGMVVYDDIIELSGKKYVIDKYGKLVRNKLINYEKISDFIGEKVRGLLDYKTCFVSEDGELVEEKCELAVSYPLNKKIYDYDEYEYAYADIVLNSEQEKSKKYGIYKVK